MAREIESNNKDHQQAAVDTQRDYDPHKSHHNSKRPTSSFDSFGYLNNKKVTENNTQLENNQQGGSTLLCFQYFCKLMSILS